MHCIGDECFLSPRAKSDPDTAARHRRVRFLLIVCICAGAGHTISPRIDEPVTRELSALAPPVVMVSALTEG